MTLNELRFPFPGWKFYIRGFGLSALGLGFLGLGLADLAFVSWKRASVLFIAGGVFALLLGLAIIVLIWFTFLYGTINIWLRWQQPRRPSVIVNADGARFLASRRPVHIPWRDVEEIHLNRSLLPGSVVTKVSMRLTPSATAVHDGPVNVPGTRYLNIGLMSDLDVPEDAAQQFFSDTVGPRLRITETDRRTPSSAYGYR